MRQKPRKEGFLLFSLGPTFLAKRPEALEKNRANQGRVPLVPPAAVLRGDEVLKTLLIMVGV